ncbi:MULTISPECIES: DNA-binding protein [unclassified Mesorhizobium]|uniref:DNA-binding protein n=1 Tax=unclassified Mesorhizobium TaxID=325217 RepID=UPI0016753910|nr:MULTISPECIES: DNA-binding protein [unclassified Mesorhizobium]
MTLDEALTQATVSVQTAGHVFFKLGRNASYEAAKRGDFETIRVGGKIVVPVAPIAARLGLRMKLSGVEGAGVPT